MKRLSIIIILILLLVGCAGDGPIGSSYETDELTDWDNIVEVRAFFNTYDDELVVGYIAGRDGIYQLNEQCVAYAIAWRNLAALKGKNLEIQVITPSVYNTTFDNRDIRKNHAILLAIVGGYKLYYIEYKPLEIRLAGSVR